MAKKYKRQQSKRPRRPFFRLLKKGKIKKEKIKALQYTCEWCDKKKNKEELELHHIDWGTAEPSYVMVAVLLNGNLAHREEHRAGYDPTALRLVCRECHEEIHRQPELAEQRGFRTLKTKSNKKKKGRQRERWKR